MQKTLWWHKTGPKLSMAKDVYGYRLYIDDLNPEQHITWRLTKQEIFTIAWQLVLYALRN